MMNKDLVFAATLGALAFVMPLVFVAFFRMMAWVVGVDVDSGVTLGLSILFGWVSAYFISVLASEFWEDRK